MKDAIKNIIYRLLSRYLVKVGDAEQVYLTFDDGPHPQNTNKILDVLSKHNTKATFFMSGSEMEKYPDIVKEVIVQGHTVGYHSYHHISMKELSIKDIFSDLNYANNLNAKFDCKIKTFRPPYGDLTFSSIFWIIINNWKIIMWSKDSRDSFDAKEKVVDNILSEKIKKGEILLFHDDYNDTPYIVDEILIGVKKRNVKFGVF